MRLAILAFLAAACGSSKPAEPEEPETPAITGPVTPKEPEIGPEIDAFHSALAKRWHAVGPTRMTEVCGALGDLQTKLTAVRNVGAPGGLDEEVWTSAMKRMTTTLEKMKPVCGASDLKAFEAAFNQVHLAFHDYMDLVVGDHGHGQGDGRGGRRGIR
jgi:hypothetical protein